MSTAPPTSSASTPRSRAITSPTCTPPCCTCSASTRTGWKCPAGAASTSTAAASSATSCRENRRAGGVNALRKLTRRFRRGLTPPARHRNSLTAEPLAQALGRGDQAGHLLVGLVDGRRLAGVGGEAAVGVQGDAPGFHVLRTGQ